MSEPCISYLDSLRLKAASSALAAASGLLGKQDTEVFQPGAKAGAC
jgi:hypothetical protein